MILYEYPFNERIRTYLRLEHLLHRLGYLLERKDALDHHFALMTLFDTMDMIGRVDVKTDLLKDLENQKAYLALQRDLQRAQQLHAQGRTYIEIGLELGFGRDTVKKHLATQM